MIYFLYRDSQWWHDESKNGTTDHILRMVFVVWHSSEGCEECEQSTANLDERFDESEVAGDHSLVEVDNAEPHAVCGETGVTGDEAESHVVQSALIVTQLRVSPATEVGHIVRSIHCPANIFSKLYVRIANFNEMRPQPSWNDVDNSDKLDETIYQL